MADRVLTRRTAVSITFDGTDITDDIRPYLLGIVYTDDEDDLADDLKIEVQDRDDVWLEHWLAEAVEAGCRGQALHQRGYQAGGLGQHQYAENGSL